jgi:hypothetical protein
MVWSEGSYLVGGVVGTFSTRGGITIADWIKGRRR